jgi:hypothetical protein
LRRPFYKRSISDQPFEARAARRLRRAFGVPVSVDELADEPVVSVVVLDPVVPPALLLDAPAFAPRRPMLLLVLPAPVLLASGFDAPCWPAAVPGPARPALSVSAGDPEAAYAPATVADMHPAINATQSFLIQTSRIKVWPRTAP